MNENEQIQEMAKIIDDIQCVTMPIEACRAETRLGNSCAVCKAKRLYSKGYRKVESGEWISYGINMTGTVGNWKCSACNKTSLSPSDFCGRCGADMRGEDDV